MEPKRVVFLRKCYRCFYDFPIKNLVLNRENLKMIFRRGEGNNPTRAANSCKKLMDCCEVTEVREALIHLLLMSHWNQTQIRNFVQEIEKKLELTAKPRYNFSKIGDVDSIMSDYRISITKDDLDALLDPTNLTHPWFVIPIIIPPQYERWEIVGEERADKVNHLIFIVGDIHQKLLKLVDSNVSYLDCSPALEPTLWIYGDVIQVLEELLNEISGGFWKSSYVQGPDCPQDKGECCTVGLYTVEKVLKNEEIPSTILPSVRQNYRQKMHLVLTN